MAGTKNRQHRSQLATVFVAAAASSLLWPAVPWSPVEACTSILVSKGASADGSTMITYAADSHELYGSLEFLPAGQHAPGEKLDVHDWDHGTFLGKIPQVEKTFSVVGLINERQVAIGETTFGGREELVDPNGGVDYGSLMKLALQRAATAREAIRVIDELAQAHGYASKGESFSISDPTEVWLMEMVGKGPEEKGMVWVARRIPDGHVSAHANQARIRTFPRNDPASCLFSPDVVSFARKKGYFAGKDEDFSFADAYAPLDGESLRVCEARVWNVFRRIAPAATPPIDYVLAVPDARPLPLWVRPEKKLAVADVIGLMRDHFEGTPLDLSKGVGAGPYALPYRWRPMTWVLDGVKYVNERAISTQQTGFSLLAQARSTLPDPVGGVLWFGVDDTYSTVYLPFYCGLRSIPRGFAAGVATLHTFSWESAFWIFNWVANFAYSRYSDMIGDIQVVQRELESGFFARQAEVDSAARALYAQSPELARDYLTRYSLEQAELTLARWRKLGEQLLVKYMDGNVKDELGKVTHPPYPEHWYRRIVQESGVQVRLGRLPGEPEPAASPQAPGAGAAGPGAAGVATAPPAEPRPDPGLAGQRFSTPEELGPLAAAVPAGFPWATELLLLLPGTAQCGQLPRCCLRAREEASGKLVVRVPLHAAEAGPGGGGPGSAGVTGAARCGLPGWLVQLPREEQRVPETRYWKGKE